MVRHGQTEPYKEESVFIRTAHLQITKSEFQPFMLRVTVCQKYMFGQILVKIWTLELAPNIKDRHHMGPRTCCKKHLLGFQTP